MGARFDVHARHRRFLSLDRSTGAQSPIDGRAPRHARGARDLETEDDFDAARGIGLAHVLGLIAWACIAVVAWLAMALF